MGCLREIKRIGGGTAGQSDRRGGGVGGAAVPPKPFGTRDSRGAVPGGGIFLGLIRIILTPVSAAICRRGGWMVTTAIRIRNGGSCSIGQRD